MTHYGIVCALYSEAAAFTATRPPAQQSVAIDAQTSLIVSGMGRERARQAGRLLIEAGVDCLVSFGTAGALAPALRPGDLVASQQVYEAEKKYTVNAALPTSMQECLFRNNITVHTGPLACAAQPLASVAAKRELFRQTDAIAVDMESAAVLEMAQSNGMTACVLRVIVDDAHTVLPAAALRRVDEFGRTDMPGLVSDLLSAPRQIPAILRLACASRRAARIMKLVATCQSQRTGL